MVEVPLHARHIELGAKMGPFGGWDMPIEYSTGTKIEHAAVRNDVGLFDVSHMGKLRILGPGAVEFINRMLTNDLHRIQSGQAQYSMMCNEQGGIIDDMIVYLVGDEEVRIIPNASNASTVARVLEDAAPEGITIENKHTEQGIVAVQGPKSAELLKRLGLPTEHEYMSFVDANWEGNQLTICRTGYTGEQGYEIVIGNTGVQPLWDTLLEKGKDLGVLPIGLGARDTLRTEMGYPLHGQDISLEISPVQARAGWAVGWKKDFFVGKAALEAEKEAGPKRVSWGLKATGRGIPRSHMAVKNIAGEVIGETTSGTFSITLEEGIAIALLSPDSKEGDAVVIDVRGRDLAAVVVKPPFVKTSAK
jgi:aminomethyltransferase